MKKGIYAFIIVLAMISIGTGTYFAVNNNYEPKENEKEISSPENNSDETPPPESKPPIENIEIPIEENIAVDNSDDNNNTQSTEVVNGATKINYIEMSNMISQKQTFAIAIVRSTCGPCLSYMPTLDQVAKDQNIKIYMIDLNDITKEDNTKLLNQFKIHGTPTTLIFNNGVEQTNCQHSGNMDANTLINLLKSYNYIK